MTKKKKKKHCNSLNLFSNANCYRTVCWKRLHLDPDPNPDPKLNYGSGFEHANNFWSGRIRIHNPGVSRLSREMKFTWIGGVELVWSTVHFHVKFICFGKILLFRLHVINFQNWNVVILAKVFLGNPKSFYMKFN